MSFVKVLPSSITPISTKWIFTLKKRYSNGNITKYKVRLVAKGFTQKKGIDFELTFSPTLNIDSLKLIVSIASKFHWNIIQLDKKVAYLNGPLDKEIYVSFTPSDDNFRLVLATQQSSLRIKPIKPSVEYFVYRFP